MDMYKNKKSLIRGLLAIFICFSLVFFFLFIRELELLKSIEGFDILKKEIVRVLVLKLVSLILVFGAFLSYTLAVFNKESNTDFLTEVYNKRKFEKTLVKNYKQENHFTLFIIDVDNFKGVNDTYGHVFGDQVLIDLTKRLQDISKGVYRIGGDEFALISRNKQTYQKLIALQSEELYIGKIKYSFSFGCEKSRLFDRLELVKAADSNMYKNKKELS